MPESGIMSCLSVIPKVLLAGAITLMDEAYYKLAVWLNDRGRSHPFVYRNIYIRYIITLRNRSFYASFNCNLLSLPTLTRPSLSSSSSSLENYRLQSKYENHLIGKVALFQFVNSFLSLFYIAFYLRDQEKLKEVIQPNRIN